MSITDFLIGFFLANSLAHFIIGISGIRFLGLFGYSSKGNYAYSALQFLVAIILFFYNYNFDTLLNNATILGVLAVLIPYFIFGKALVKSFKK